MARSGWKTISAWVGCLFMAGVSCNSASAALELTSVRPDRVPASQATTVALQGQGFYNFASVDLSGKNPVTIEDSWSVSLDEIDLVPKGIITAGSLDVEVPANLAPGSYDVFVASPSGESSLLKDGLVIVDDSNLRLTIEDAPGGAGQERASYSLVLGQSADFFAVGRSQDDGSFLLDVDGSWRLDTAIGVLSQTQGTRTSFSSSELGTNLLHVDTLDYGSATSAISVADAIGTSLSLYFDNVGIDENLVGFPVLVTLTPANFNYSLAAPQGADLRFIDDDDLTVLPHQIEQWNVGGTSHVWVTVPRIDANSATDHIHLHYGDLGIAPGEDPAGVWTGYHAVYHLGESAAGAANEIKDSSLPAHNGQGGTTATTQAPTQTLGKIGRAQLFDGVDDEILITPSDSFIFSAPALTVEYWASWPATGRLMNTVSKGGTPGGYRSGIDEMGLVGAYVNGLLLHDPTPPTNNVFHYIVVTWDDSSMRIYVDGALGIEAPLSGGFVSANDPFYLGRATAGVHFTGVLDELRVLNAALSEAWIAAQYRSMQDNYISFAPF